MGSRACSCSMFRDLKGCLIREEEFQNLPYDVGTTLLQNTLSLIQSTISCCSLYTRIRAMKGVHRNPKQKSIQKNLRLGRSYCPAPLIISLVSFSYSSPKYSLALSSTQRIQSSWNFMASLGASRVHSTVHPLPAVPLSFKSSTASFFAIFSKSTLSSCSSIIKRLSSPARISRLKRTFPGTVFVLPGLKVTIPVLAKQECFVARR